MKRLAAALWARRYDIGALTGAGVMAAGIGCIYWPAGVIAGGIVLAGWSYIGSRTEAAERRGATL